MAKIDFSTPIMNFNDDTVVDSEGKMLDLGIVCINSLLAIFPNEDISGVEKLRRFNLAQDISTGLGQMDLDTEAIGLLKTLIEKTYGVLVYGRAMEILSH